jgi:hypothetical protein
MYPMATWKTKMGQRDYGPPTLYLARCSIMAVTSAGGRTFRLYVCTCTWPPTHLKASTGKGVVDPMF